MLASEGVRAEWLSNCAAGSVEILANQKSCRLQG